MKFTFKHTNLTILDLKKSLAFYKEALGLEEVRRIEAVILPLCTWVTV